MKQISENEAKKIINKNRGHGKFECEVFTIYEQRVISDCYYGDCADKQCNHKQTISIPKCIVNYRASKPCFFYIKKEEYYEEPVHYHGTLLFDGSGIDKYYI